MPSCLRWVSCRPQFSLSWLSLPTPPVTPLLSFPLFHLLPYNSCLSVSLVHVLMSFHFILPPLPVLHLPSLSLTPLLYFPYCHFFYTLSHHHFLSKFIFTPLRYLSMLPLICLSPFVCISSRHSPITSVFSSLLLSCLTAFSYSFPPSFPPFPHFPFLTFTPRYPALRHQDSNCRQSRVDL